MWSGPRNISTALMRSFSSRPDTAVSDEPLYAHYLRVTNAAHPGREQVLSHHDADWRSVVSDLLGPVPGGKGVWYQKHMAHHLTPEVDRGFVRSLTNCFLIRDPADMITSYIKVLPNPTPRDLGLPQQLELFEAERERLGHAPPVIDSRDVLVDPRGALSALCERLEIPFVDAMLTWPRGPHGSDGVWGPHWYAAVYESTTFEPYRPKGETVPSRLAQVYDECRGIYDALAMHRLR